MPVPSTAPAPFRRWELLLPLAVFAILAAVLLPRGVHVTDDAFITLRYARNLAEGAGLVYNPGERVLGTSAPLFALLLSPLARLLGTDSLPGIAVTTNLLLLAAGAALAYRILRRSVPPYLAATATLAAFAPLETMRVFVSGMETPLYLVLLLLVFELVLRGRATASLLVAGFLPFVHPEAGLAIPVALAGLRLKDGRWPRPTTWAGLVPGALLGLGLTLAYGSPIPHSVAAKRLVYTQPPGHAAEHLSVALLEPFLASALPELLAIAAPLLVACVLGATLLGGRAGLLEPRLALPALFAVSYLALFAVANPRFFPWYGLPLALSATLAAAGAASGPARRMAPILSAAFVLAAAGHLAAYRPHPSEEREEAYRKVVQTLTTSKDTVIAAPEIGAIGFYSRARILDTSALVSPSALPFHERWFAGAGKGNRDKETGAIVPPGLIEALRPDYLIALTVFVDDLLAVSPDALSGYDLVREVDAKAYRSRAVLVYQRRR